MGLPKNLHGPNTYKVWGYYITQSPLCDWASKPSRARPIKICTRD